MSFSFRFRLCELGGGRCKRKWQCFTGLSTFWYWPLPLAFGLYLFYEMRPHLSCKDFLLSVAKAVSNRPVRPRPNRSAGRIGKGLEDGIPTQRSTVPKCYWDSNWHPCGFSSFPRNGAPI